MRTGLPTGLLAVLPAVLLVLLPAAGARAAPGPAVPAGGFGWPLPGPPRVVRPFSAPASAWGAGHRGVDLAAWPGTPVRAAGPGRVSYAGVLAGRGVVAVTHAGGLRTTYEPLAVAVRVGQPVSAGQVLGRLVAGHPSCPTCLHWGLRRGEDYLDPLALVRRPRVRLLPLGPAGPPAGPLDPVRPVPEPGPATAPPVVTAARPVARHDGPSGAVPAALAATTAGLLAAGAVRRR